MEVRKNLWKDETKVVAECESRVPDGTCKCMVASIQLSIKKALKQGFNIEKGLQSMPIMWGINTRGKKATGIADKPKALPYWLRVNLRKLLNCILRFHYCLKGSSRLWQRCFWAQFRSSISELSDDEDDDDDELILWYGWLTKSV